MSRFVVIEGLIGAGKSTFISYLKETCQTEYVFVKEPFELFRQFQDFNTFELLRTNPLQHAALVQLHIIRSLRQFYKDLLTEATPGKTYVCERFISSPFVFTNALYRQGYVSEFARNLLVDLTREYVEEVGIAPTHIFYLTTNLDTCLHRIKCRGRKEEIPFVSETYLHNLTLAYDRYFLEIESEGETLVRASTCSNNLQQLAVEFEQFLSVEHPHGASQL